MTGENLLKDGERIDDLQCKGFRIIQNPSQFCFGMDAVLLANFATGKKRAAGIDLGTGTGIIPLLMLAKDKAASFTAVEIQPEMADMAERSAKLNDISDRLKVVCGDICHINPPKSENRKQEAGERIDDVRTTGERADIDRVADDRKTGECEICNHADRLGDENTISEYRALWREKFEIVTSNPPYIADTGGLHNPKDAVNIARHEIMVKLEDVIRAASYLLKMGGSFAMVHKPFRLTEITELMLKYKLSPKRMQLVQPREGSEPNMLLIEAVKGGHSGLRILPTLNVYNPDGSYTEELLAYYNNNR